ncbi:MAG TPA: hypothetical protein VNK05_08930, partial [Chloroflexota bacterium]|nr:hypothetical protein [Chloroflexota bacterium]
MKFSLIRADDQVHLEVETFNLEPQRAGAGYELRPVTTGQPGHISVAFPKQHVMEYVGTPALPFPKQIGPIFSAATTRVVFLVPPGTAAIPFTVAGILGALPALPLVTDGSAGTVGLAQGQPEPRAASTAELVLDAMGGSPNGAAGGAPGRTLGAAEAAVAGAARSAPASDGAAQNGAPGGALLAELRARARARRRAPEAEPALAPAASGGPSGPVSLAPARGPVEPAPADLPAAAAAAAGAPGVTAMGFPSRLYLNVPGGETRMAHAASPVADAGNVELWHSRLSRRAANGRLVEVPANVTALRALVQQPTADPALSDATINSVLDTNAQTAISNQTTLSPKIPATARRLWLSPLGAWLDAHGSWPGHSVQGWRHRMVMGRDHYVQVVQKGRLYPLGHEAVLVSTMERTSPSRNGWVSTLVRRDTIRVTQAERDFGAPADPAGRQWPWQTVELLTLESPAGLKKTVFTDVATKKEVSYLEVGGLPFRFDCQAEDRGHRVATFDLPLLFVPDGLTNLAGVASWFAGAEAQGLGFRGLDLDGQAVALAPPTGGATPPDTTTVVAHSAPLVVSPGGPLGFRPSMPNVQGIVPALARFSPEGGLPRTVSLAPSYLSHGFDPANNPGEALFAFASPAVG